MSLISTIFPPPDSVTDLASTPAKVPSAQIRTFTVAPAASVNEPETAAPSRVNETFAAETALTSTSPPMENIPATDMLFQGTVTLALSSIARFLSDISRFSIPNHFVRSAEWTACRTSLLSKTGREEQATMTTLAGLVVVLMMLARQIAELFELVKRLFDF